MSFQQTVNFNQALGVPGEFFTDGPRRVAPYILQSADAANNVVGRAFTVTAEGVATAGGTNLRFAGILIHPKHYAAGGTAAAGTLAPTMTLRNGEIGELCTMGEIIVQTPAAITIGSLVKYNNLTGVLGFGTAGAGETQIPNAMVTRFTPDAAGLAVITLTN